MVQFRRKLRAKSRTSLFGSDSIDNVFRGGMTLTIAVEEIGDPVTIYVEKKRPFKEDTAKIGTLGPGEVWAIHLDGVVGVSAQPQGTNDSFVQCALVPSPFNFN